MQQGDTLHLFSATSISVLLKASAAPWAAELSTNEMRNQRHISMVKNIKNRNIGREKAASTRVAPFTDHLDLGRAADLVVIFS
jgi:hypothetical protein